MQISEFYKQCETNAKQITGFIPGKKEDVSYDIDILTNNYCKAIDEYDEPLKNAYIGALMLRYWHMIYYYKNISPNVDLDTIIEWIFDGIQRACKYRSWLTSDKLKNNKRGAEICINNAIDTSRKRFYKYSNANKRKDFFFSNAVSSLDDMESFECEQCLSVSEESYPLDVEIVNNLLSQGEIIGSIIVDKLINEDGYINSKHLNTSLENINVSYLNYFMNKYQIKDMNKFMSVFKKLCVRRGRSLSGTSRRTLAHLSKMSIIKELLGR